MSKNITVDFIGNDIDVAIPDFNPKNVPDQEYSVTPLGDSGLITRSLVTKKNKDEFEIQSSILDGSNGEEISKITSIEAPENVQFSLESGMKDILFGAEDVVKEAYQVTLSKLLRLEKTMNYISENKEPAHRGPEM